MWRLISALCIMSIVAILGVQRGQAGSPERPQWRSPFDGADHGRLDLAAIRKSTKVPPPAEWALPAEIALEAPAIRRAARVLVWLPPAEIASPDPLVMPARPTSAAWAPPLEIAPEAPVVEGRSAVGEDAVWLPPAEIASATVDAAVRAVGRPERPSPIRPALPWSLPAEIAPRVSALDNATRVADATLVWRPPLEIAPVSARAGDGVEKRV